MTDETVDTDSDLGFKPAVADDHPPAASKAARKSKGFPRRGSFRRQITSVAVLVGALTSVGGGYALLAPTSGAADTTTSSADIAKGRQLFETSCITCHGANLQGVKDRGPSLAGAGGAATYFQVSTGRMPAARQGSDNKRKPSLYTMEETQQLAAYVQTLGGPEVPHGDLRGDSSNMSEGGELFRLNCASCHNFAGKGAPLSAGKVAPSLNHATDAQMYTAMLSGPESMPVYSNNQITPEQKRAIINYIQNLKTSKEPGGAGLDRIGPVSEGLLIWTVGLGALMIAILWIGKKS